MEDVASHPDLTSPELNAVMREILDQTEGGLGLAVADITSARLLGVAHNIPYFNQGYLDAVAAGAVSMFRGAEVQHIEGLLTDLSGVVHRKTIDEVQMTTHRTIHFMMVLPNHRNSVVVLITDRRTSLGMAWSMVRGSSLRIEPVLESLGIDPADDANPQ